MAPRRVLAIRHGESEWNVLRRTYTTEEEQYCDAMYVPDCSITAKGIEQSRSAGSVLSEKLGQEDEKNIVVLVSPLRRALQTALNVLEACPQKPPGKPLVHPDCAEVMADACDIGSTVEALDKEFPDKFDFTMLKTRPQFWWAYHRSLEDTWKRMRIEDDEGIETPASALKRFEEFQEYVNTNVALDQKVVVIVCHSETIWYFTSQVISGTRYGVWTDNGEVVDCTHAFIGVGEPIEPKLLTLH